VNAETELLLRYLDGELSPAEAQRFRARLANRPQLRRELRDMQRVGGLVRGWSKTAEARGGGLVEPTLRRIRAAERFRSASATLACGLALGLLLVLRGSSPALPAAPHVEHLEVSHFLAGAAIERVEASHQQAQVFVVGRTSTPVVWLEDDAQEEDGSPEQDPG
jgi:anti-sigma factor RsiW